MPAEFPSRICQIIARKQWMTCRKYAEKRREHEELRGGRCRGHTGGAQGTGAEHRPGVYGRAGRENGREGAKERERKLARGSRNCESAKRGWDTVKGRVLGRAEGAICQTGPGRAENARARSER